MTNTSTDRELSQAEKACIIGFYRCSHNVSMVAEVMEVSKLCIENELNFYFGVKLLNYK